MRWFVLLIGLAILAGCGADHRRYESAAQFDRAQAEDDWVSIGKFGNGWPARTEEVITAYAAIKFTRDNGTPHQYSGFEGYELKVVKLRGPEGQELIRILRSREMTGVVGDVLHAD